ncbi:MAG: xylulokinase [Spirochaetaceae bacterium]|nr:xylulokinase [Spirochaetaceae bacterium]MCF7948406.1 xylulokinase [Spirochaetia bacterium]MCF7950855.1 xylulokinase [Spirochaetaceae bacterium]
MNTGKTIIGVDNGTQSTKVIFYDIENKRIAALARASHQLISKENGRREQKAEWWIQALRECFAQIDPEIKQTAVAVGVSGQQHGFVPLDKNGTPVYNVKLWNDTETYEECEQITAAYGGKEKLVHEVGNPILPGFTAGKILWLKKNKPEAYSQLARILLPHDYINYYLTGRYFTEPGDASGTAYFNIYSKTWAAKVLKAIDPDTDLYAKLPKIINNNEIGGKLTGERAAEFGLPKGIPVSSGGGDNMMGAIGTGAVSEGVVTVSLGTSGTIYSFRTQAMVDLKDRLSAFCSSNDGWLPLLCTMNCTVAVEQFRRLLDKSVKETDELVETVPPGSDGLITLPFFNGERTPNLPHGKGCLCGMNTENLSQGHTLRSAMEAAAFGLRLGLDAFREQGLSPETVHLIGGGSNSPEWRQIIADILEVPIECPESEEAAAFGAALQALWAINDEHTSLDNIVKEHIRYDRKRRTTPHSKNYDVYRKRYSEYMQYIEALTPLFK